MLIGYARISKADGSQSLDLQRDALREAGVSDDAIYEDQASGQREDRPGLAAFLKAARQGDVIVVWRLDRLGRNLRHLVNLVQDLNDRDIGIRVLAGQGASIDTTTASGKFVFALFAALAEFERELIRERTLAGLASARARGRKGGRPHALSKAQVRLAQAGAARHEGQRAMPRASSHPEKEAGDLGRIFDLRCCRGVDAETATKSEGQRVRTKAIRQREISKILDENSKLNERVQDLRRLAGSGVASSSGASARL